MSAESAASTPALVRVSRTRIVLPVATLALAMCLPADGVRAQDQSTIELRQVEAREFGTEAFRLDRPATIAIRATGGGPDATDRVARARDAVVRLVSRVVDVSDSRDDAAWVANAWIINAVTREVVWRLDEAETSERDGLQRFEGELELPAGTYEVYYANFPRVGWNNGRPNWQYDRDAADRLGIELAIENGRLTRVAPERSRELFGASAVVALGREGDRAYERVAFDIDRDVLLDVYVVGEASASRKYDHGWIMNADTREIVWEFDYERSMPAGGIARNRSAHERITLPQGRYAAFFERDRSHGPGNWRSVPPADPAFGGLTLRVVNASDRSAFRTYPYEPVAVRESIVSLVRLGDDETVSEGFTLDEPMDVRIFAVGEGRQDAMFDRGWILDAATRQPVWTMEFEETQHAGGSSKNRLYDGVVRLEAGSYIVNFRTDGSHAYEDWNGSPPMEAEFWGITVLPAEGPLDRNVVRPYDEAADPSVIARIVQVRDGQQVRRGFTLEEDTDVRVYALGEGESGSMFDYARIVDVRGREVWRMDYEATERAGGVRKNRVFNGVVRLPAGDYEVIYRTDDSHAFGRWNGSPPTDPRSWGVTLRRER